VIQTFTCGGCPAVWTAQAAAHCGACHASFSGIRLFDRHRSLVGLHGRCVDPAGLMSRGEPICELRDGVWRSPEMDDAARERVRRPR